MMPQTSLCATAVYCCSKGTARWSPRPVTRNTTGNPGMAKGGSGDVLAGMILSLVGQGLAPQDAARVGAWLHGRTGDVCANRLSEYGMTPTDMLAMLPEVLHEYNTREW